MENMEPSDLLKTYLVRQLLSAKAALLDVEKEEEIEALHRFRVALRRYRSVLAAYEEELYALQAVAKVMLKHTNALREIDIFLDTLDTDKYPNLAAAIRKHRRKLYKAEWDAETVSRFSGMLNTLMSDTLEMRFSYDDTMLILRGDELCSRAEAFHDRLHKNIDEEAIHATRIMYKQARYVLEFLAETSLADERKRIKRIKKTLEKFGDIQDAANQLQWLKRFCRNNPSDECRALYRQRRKKLLKLKAKL